MLLVMMSMKIYANIKEQIINLPNISFRLMPQSVTTFEQGSLFHKIEQVSRLMTLCRRRYVYLRPSSFAQQLQFPSET